MWHAARWRECGQGMVGIGGPVAARLTDFDKSGSQRKRRVAGEIGDDQHLVTQRGHEEQVDFREYARHFLGDLAAQAIGLNEVDCREESRLPEDVWPRVRNLRF